MANSIPMRSSLGFLNFLSKFQVNRIKADTDHELLSNPEAQDVIVKYFKNNNDRYLELVKLEKENV